MEDDPARLPVRRDRLEERQEVRRPDDGDARGVDVGGEGDAGEGGVAAVGAAHDRDLLRVGDPLLHEVLHAPREVVLHQVAPLVVPGVEELLAVAGGAAEVGGEDGVAAVREELRVVVEAPAVAGPRAAVREDDEREGSWRGSPSGP